MTVLYSTETAEEAFEWECCFIVVAREKGHNLTNGTDGGDGGGCAKMGAANKSVPKSLEHRAKVSATMTGVPKSAAARAKMSAAGMVKTFSAEHRAKLRVANLRRVVVKCEAELAACYAEVK